MQRGPLKLKARTVIFQFSIVLLLSTAPASAETLYLENGQVLRGIVVGQDRETVRFRTSNGLLTIPKTQIRRMTFDRYDPGDTEAEKEARRKSEEERRKIVDELNRELDRRREGLEKKIEEEDDRKQEERAFFQNEFLQEKERRKKEGFQRSLILPGWGQYHKNQPDRGKIYMGSFLTLLGTVLLADYVYKQSYAGYSKENNNYALFLYQRHNPIFAYSYYKKAVAERDRANQSAAIRTGALLGLGLVYVISAADARYTDPELDWLTQSPLPPQQFQIAFRYAFE